MIDFKEGLKYLHKKSETHEADLNATEAKIQALEKRLEEQQKSLNILIAEREAALKKKQAVQKPLKKIVYYVTGIMPGRAWLMSAEGVSMTVAQGDFIPGYGRIIRVDALAGTVMTEHGLIHSREGDR